MNRLNFYCVLREVKEISMRIGTGTIEVKNKQSAKATIFNVFCFILASSLFGLTFALAILGGF
tara:strand:+ start:1186 stop:1374 length:189 start_codon:yes stop_codon:yes gene_type:complete